MTGRPEGPAARRDGVIIREVGPRDGLQLEAPLSTDAKLTLIDALVAAGISRIEVTSFVSAKAVPALADAERVVAAVRDRTEVAWSALVPNRIGADRALRAGVTELEYVVSAADGHSLANVHRTTAEAVGQIGAIVAAAHAAGATCEVIVATAWDCPFDGPTPVGRTLEVCRAARDLGADRLCLADTIGTATPGRVQDLLGAVGAECGSLPLGAHFHNTRGAGLACAWAAVEAGVVMLDASIAGLGGCPFAPGATGNVATEELVYLLEDSGIATGINWDMLQVAAAIASDLVGSTTVSNVLRAGGPPRPLGRR